MRVLTRFKKPKARRILGGALGLLLVLNLVLVPATPVLAVLPLGHYFYGNVTSQGVSVDLGTVITARVAGLEYTTSVYAVVDVGNKYGWHPNEFSIPGDDPDTPDIEGASAGDSIEFYIGDIKLHLYDVEAGVWLDSYLFESGGTTELNLETTRDTTPPTVVSTTPEDGATATIDVVVSATFNEDVTAVDLTGITIDEVTGILATLDEVTDTITIAHDDFALDTPYTVTIPDGVVQDLAGNPNTEFSWSFTSVTITFTITPTAGPGGSIDPSEVVEVAYDGSQLFTITADANYRIADVLIDGVSIAPPNVEVFHVRFEHVTYDRTITASFASVGPVSFTTTLLEGWNLLSTPILLAADSDTLGQIFRTDVGNIEVSYSWDGEKWDLLTNDYKLLPLYAIYVKVSASATAEFIPSGERSEPPSRELQRGLNLIGPAPALAEGVFPDTPLGLALISIEEAEGGLRGYTMVVSPAHNQTAWSYALGGEIKDLIPFKGYWVVMENGPDTLYGFSTTPIP